MSWSEMPGCLLRLRYAQVSADSADLDELPDWSPLAGQKGTLKPSIRDLVVYDPQGAKIVVELDTVQVEVDADGWLCKRTEDGVLIPLRVAPTDDPLMTSQGWTYTLTLGTRRIGPFSAPSGGVVELADYVTAPATDATKAWVERIPELIELLTGGGSGDIITSETQEAAPLGGSIATGTGWSLGDGWSGDAESGFTNASGSTGVLTWTPDPELPAGRYVVEFTSSVPVSSVPDLQVSLADAPPAYVYDGQADTYRAYRAGFAITAPGPLRFLPKSGFTGTISNVAVYAVEGPSGSAQSITDSLGGVVSETRALRSGDESLFVGPGAGQYTVPTPRPLKNLGLGIKALTQNLTGYWNTAVGSEVLTENTSGSRNVAIGMRALTENRSGYRNTAVGQSTMRFNATGHSNTTLGADTLYRSIDGSYNVAIGLSAMASTLHGSYNVAIGRSAMMSAETDNCVGVGRMALYRAKAEGNTGVGFYAGAFVEGPDNTAVGARAAQNAGAGSSNTGVGSNAARGDSFPANFSDVTAVGASAAYSATSTTNEVVAVGVRAVERLTGDRNIGIGVNALRGGDTDATGRRNIGIGHRSGEQITTGEFNAILGVNSGMALTTGSRNLIIGTSSAAALASGNENTIIGGSAGSGVTGNRNLVIGYAQTVSGSYKLNLGGVLHGDMTTAGKRAGIGVTDPTARFEVMAPSATLAPVKLNPGALLATPQAGAIEYDGDALYLTTSDGVRHQMAVGAA